MHPLRDFLWGRRVFAALAFAVPELRRSASLAEVRVCRAIVLDERGFNMIKSAVGHAACLSLLRGQRLILACGQCVDIAKNCCHENAPSSDPGMVESNMIRELLRTLGNDTDCQPMVLYGGAAESPANRWNLTRWRLPSVGPVVLFIKVTKAIKKFSATGSRSLTSFISF